MKFIIIIVHVDRKNFQWSGAIPNHIVRVPDNVAAHRRSFRWSGMICHRPQIIPEIIESMFWYIIKILSLVYRNNREILQYMRTKEKTPPRVFVPEILFYFPKLLFFTTPVGYFSYIFYVCVNNYFMTNVPII